MVKTVGKKVFPKILKTLNVTLPPNTDINVHIMYFNS